MTPELPPIAAAYVAAMNGNDNAALVACFTPDARVQDEGKEQRGTTQIAAWFDDVKRRYQVAMTVTKFMELGAETILTAEVTGTFEGSPITLHHRLRIENGLIQALSIGG